MVEHASPPPAAPVDPSIEKLAETGDTEGDSKAGSTPTSQQQVGAKPSPTGNGNVATYPGGFAIDVCFEASKLPLDVAIFNSARAAGGDEKIRKYLQAVLIIGGTALIPGMAHALESRCASHHATIADRLIQFNFLGCKPSQRPSFPIWRKSRLFLLLKK
jgi:actin-related protein 8